MTKWVRMSRIPIFSRVLNCFPLTAGENPRDQYNRIV